MSAETRKVLEMLAEGKITSEDAERLLDKLAAAPDESAAKGNGNNGTTPSATHKKFMRIQIERPGGDDVNVRVPLNFVRSGVKLVSILPPKIIDKLQQEGIDPKVVSEFTQQARESLDMETKSGKRVRVFCE